MDDEETTANESRANGANNQSQVVFIVTANESRANNQSQVVIIVITNKS